MLFVGTENCLRVDSQVSCLGTARMLDQDRSIYMSDQSQSHGLIRTGQYTIAFAKRKGAYSKILSKKDINCETLIID